MRTITCTLLCIFLNFSCISAQTYFNEWIDHTQTYYKFQIEENGIYRISYETLQAVGLEGKASEGFHLFVNGKEIPIFTSNNVLLSEGDYIEFYGERNDGSFDTQLYSSATYQLTDQQSLFTKRAAYYLMWDDSFTALRYKEGVNDLSEPLPEPEKYFLHTERYIARNVFWLGEPTRFGTLGINYPDFEKGEGWVSSSIFGGNTKSINISTIGVYEEEAVPNAAFETKIVGQDNDLFTVIDHHLQVSIGEQIHLDESFEGYEILQLNSNIELQDLQHPRTTFTYKSVGNLASSPNKDIQAISYAFLTYPRQFDFGKYASGEVIPSNNFAFELEDHSEKYFEVSNFGEGGNAILYDMSHQLRMEIQLEEGVYPIHLPANAQTGAGRSLFLVEDVAVQTVETLEERQFADFQLNENQGDYMLVYHASLAEGDTDWVQAYADYRASETGGSRQVVLVDIEELYDQFAWGIEKHPLSIRHFVNFAMDRWAEQPKLLFLMGKSISYRSTTTPTAFEDNLIPTYGFSPSDNYLATRNVSDYRPQVGVGRLSAQYPLQVRNYLEKVQEYEAVGEATRSNRLWRKHALFQGTTNYFTPETEQAGGINFIELPFIGGKVLDEQILEEYSEEFKTRPFIEEGFGLWMYRGASTGEIWKTEVGANPSTYQQQEGHYPLIIALSPFTGNIHKSNNSKPSMAETWALSQGHGGIGYLGGVFMTTNSILSGPQGFNAYVNTLNTQLGTNSYGLSIGEALKQTIGDIYVENTDTEYFKSVKAMSADMTFQGDPAIRPAFSFDRPEYIIENGYQHRYIDPQDNYIIRIETRNDVVLFDKTAVEQVIPIEGVYHVKNVETLQLQLRIGNLGKAVEGEFMVEVRKQDLNGENSVVLAAVSSNAPLYESMLQLEVSLAEIEEMDYQLVVEVDADNTYEEDSETNNVGVLQLSNDLISNIATPPMLKNIEIFPNPFQQQLHIGGELSVDAVVELFDIQGKLWWRQRLEGQHSLSISKDLPKGVYLLKIRDKEGIWIEKVVKE